MPDIASCTTKNQDKVRGVTLHYRQDNILISGIVVLPGLFQMILLPETS